MDSVHPIVMIHIHYVNEDGERNTAIFNLRDVKKIITVREHGQAWTRIEFRSGGWMITRVSAQRMSKVLEAAARKRWCKDFPMITVEIGEEGE